MYFKKYLAWWQEGTDALKSKKGDRPLILTLPPKKLDSDHQKPEVIQRVLEPEVKIITVRSKEMYKKQPLYRELAIKDEILDN